MEYFMERAIAWQDLSPEKRIELIEDMRQRIHDIIGEDELLDRFGSDPTDLARISENAYEWEYEMANKICEREFPHWIKMDIKCI